LLYINDASRFFLCDFWDVTQTRECVYSVRITEELRDLLNALARQVGVPATSIVVNGMEAACRYVKNSNQLVLPFELLSTTELAALKSKVFDLENKCVVLNVDSTLKKRLKKIELDSGISVANLLTKVSEGLCDYVEKTKGIALPLAVTAKAEWVALKSRLAELEAENAQLKSTGLNTAAPVSRSARTSGLAKTGGSRSGSKAKSLAYKSRLGGETITI
jgi:predicted DNA-binding protein